MITIQAEDIQGISRKEYLQIMATALEKRIAIAPAFKVTEREKEIDEILTALKLAMINRDDAKQSLDSANDAVKLNERMLIANATGSNEAKRRAAAEDTMTKNKPHLKLVEAAQEAQATSEESARNCEMVARQLAAKNRALDAQTALMNFLAGGE